MSNVLFVQVSVLCVLHSLGYLDTGYSYASLGYFAGNLCSFNVTSFHSVHPTMGNSKQAVARSVSRRESISSPDCTLCASFASPFCRTLRDSSIEQAACRLAFVLLLQASLRPLSTERAVRLLSAFAGSLASRASELGILCCGYFHLTAAQ